MGRLVAFDWEVVTTVATSRHARDRAAERCGMFPGTLADMLRQLLPWSTVYYRRSSVFGGGHRWFQYHAHVDGHVIVFAQRPDRPCLIKVITLYPLADHAWPGTSIATTD